MTRLAILAAVALSVAACSRAEHTAALPSQATILEECKTGTRTGEVCSQAQAAEAHRTHQEAESAFRNMAEGK